MLFLNSLNFVQNNGLNMPILPSTTVVPASIVQSLVVLVLFNLNSCHSSSSNSKPKYIPWGKNCQSKTDEEAMYSLYEDCDQSKGIFCQKYTQGEYCGCMIKSIQSYDRNSGECRRKPDHRCHFVNQTTQPEAYKALGYHLKCHETAECVLVNTTTLTSSMKRSDSREKEERYFCKCRRGYILSSDKLECVGLSSSGTRVGPVWIAKYPSILTLPTFLASVLVITAILKPFNLVLSPTLWTLL